MIRSLLHGSLGLGFLSLAAYSIWAFVPSIAGSEKGMYALIALVYLGGSGLILGGLLQGEQRVRRFYRLFLPAFFTYALVWSAAWFLLKGRPGEWTGSAAGTFVMALLLWRGLGKPPHFLLGALMLFLLHSAGYFAGSAWMYDTLKNGLSTLDKPAVAIAAKLGWGLLHGLGFGAGLGAVLALWQRGHTER